MTTPTLAPPQQYRPPPDLQALAEQQAATLLLQELAAASAASWPLRSALATLNRMLRAATIGGDLPPTARARIVAQLSAVAADLDPQAVADRLIAAAEAAARTGSVNAAAQIGLTLADLPPATLERTVTAVADAAGDQAAAHLADAVQALRSADTAEQARAALAVADRAPASVELAAGWAVNRAANDAVKASARHLGAELLWIAERDACVVCTALAGHVANPATGVWFDEFATFGPHRPPAPWPPGQPLMRPPRHPHCRCMVVVWLGSASGQPDLPASLQHEARRSILRGFSRPSESHRLRLAAASKLLGTGAADMPKSVRQYAAHAVAAGRFPTREVPRYPSAHRRAA
jgi:hypothetical protein